MSKKIWHSKGNPWGLFSFYLEIIDGLRWCEQNGYTPHIENIENKHYYSPKGYNGKTDIWEYYFEPIKADIKDGDEVMTVHDRFMLKEIPQNFGFRSPEGYGRRWMKDRVDKWPLVMDDDGWWRREANRIITKYGIKPNAIVQKKIDLFIQEKMNAKVKIAVHIRAGRGMKGTYHKDNIKLEAYSNLVLQKIKQLEHEDYVVFVASDSNVAIKFMEENVPNVVNYSCLRTDDYYQLGKRQHGEVIEVGWNENLEFMRNDRAQIGEEAVIESYLLSSCDMMIHWESAVAFAASYINPNLKLLPIDIYLGTKTYYEPRIRGKYDDNFKGIKKGVL